MNLELFIDGLPIDIGTAKPVLNKVFFEGFDKDANPGSYSFDFEVPATARNLKVFGSTGYADGSNYENNKTRKALLIADGIEIVKGLVMYRETVQNLKGRVDGFTLTLIYDNGDWKSRIKNAKLRDLALGNVVWSQANVNASATWTSDNANYTFPLVSYGKFVDNGKGPDHIPAFFVKPIVDKIFDVAGVTDRSTFGTSAFFKRLILPFTNENLVQSDGFAATHIIDVQKATNQTITNNSTAVIAFTTENSDPGGRWLTDTYTAGTALKTVFQADLKIDISATTDGDYYIEWYKNGVLQYTDGPGTFIPGATTDVRFISPQFSLSTGDTIQVKIRFAYYSGTSNIRVQAASKLINFVGDVAEFGTTFDLASQLPDITQLQFIEAIFGSFNVRSGVTDNGVLEWEPRDDYFTGSRDWSRFIDYGKEVKVSSLINDAPLTIRYKGKEDGTDAITTLLRNTYGDFDGSVRTISTTNFGETELVRQSIFAESYMSAFDVNAGTMSMPTLWADIDATLGAPDRSFKFEPRLLYYAGTTEGAVDNAAYSYKRTGSTNNSVAWETYSTGLGLVDKYFRSDILTAKRGKKVECEAVIPLHELIDLSKRDRIRIDGIEYLLSSLNDYNLETGRCKLELITWHKDTVVVTPAGGVPAVTGSETFKTKAKTDGDEAKIIGADGRVYTLSSGGSPGIVGAGIPNASTYWKTSTEIDDVALNTTATKKYLQQVSSLKPTFEQILSADIGDFTEAVQDSVALAFQDTDTIDLGYNDPGNAITANLRIDGATAFTSNRVPYTTASALVTSSRLTFDGTTLSILASSGAAYGLNVSGVAGAARNIFLAGQTSFSNGFTVDYTGSAMAYRFRSGVVTIDTINARATAATVFLTHTTGAIESRTAAEVLSDIGASASGHTHSLTLTGDVTGSGTVSGSIALTIANDAVSNAKLRDSGALSVIGRSANSTGDPADISATASTKEVLRVSGTTLGFGTIDDTYISNFTSAARASISIAAGSTPYLGYNSGTGEISIKALAITTVTVDTVQTSFSAWVTANYTGTQFQQGDVVILTNLGGNSPVQSWIHNGGTAGTAADFTKLESPNLTDSYIRALFSAGNSAITYDNLTGAISHTDTSTVANLDTNGAAVIDEINFDTFGHVTAITTRNLTASDIGAIGGSGTVNRVSKFATATTLSDSQIFDDGSFVVINGTSGNGRLTVRGATADSTAFALEATTSAGATRFIVRNDGRTSFYGSDAAEKWRFTEGGALQAVGAQTISTTSGDLTISATGILSVTTNATISGTLTASLSNATGDFVTATAGGLLQRRTAAQTLSDISAVGGRGNGAANHIAIWSDANTIDKDADLQFDGTTLLIGEQASLSNPSSTQVALAGITSEGLAYRKYASASNFQTVKIGGLLYSRTTRAGNATADALEQTIDGTFTLPAGFLAIDGRGIKIELSGIWVPTDAASADQMNLYFGSTLVASVSRFGNGYSGGSSTFYADITIIRRAASTNSLHIAGTFSDEHSWDTSSKAAAGLFNSLSSVTWANAQNIAVKFDPVNTPGGTEVFVLDQFNIYYI